MKVTHDGEHFKLNAKWSEITAGCGGLESKDFKDGWLHVAECCKLSEDHIGMELTAAALMGTETLPPDITAAMQRIFNEATAAGKEITLRKLARVFDPHGEFIEVPEDWYGKGAG